MRPADNRQQGGDAALQHACKRCAQQFGNLKGCVCRLFALGFNAWKFAAAVQQSTLASAARKRGCAGQPPSLRQSPKREHLVAVPISLP